MKVSKKLSPCQLVGSKKNSAAKGLNMLLNSFRFTLIQEVTLLYSQTIPRCSIWTIYLAIMQNYCGESFNYRNTTWTFVTAWSQQPTGRRAVETSSAAMPVIDERWWDNFSQGIRRPEPEHRVQWRILIVLPYRTVGCYETCRRGLTRSLLLSENTWLEILYMSLC